MCAYLCVYFFFSKKYSSGARHVRDLHAWNSREKKIEIRASSSTVTGTSAASTLTGVKKVPYNIIYFLTYELGAEPFFLFLTLSFSSSYAQVSQSLTFSSLVYECVMCMRMLFSLYIFIVLSRLLVTILAV